MEYCEILEFIHSNIDPKYKAFHQKLIPEVTNFLGVRTPAVKKLAKELACGDSRAYINSAKADTYEEAMLWGLVIGHIKADFDEVVGYIKVFVPYIDNWAVCDSFCASLKITNKNKVAMLELIKGYLCSEHEFELRFAIVMLMDYYVEPAYIDEVLDIYDRIKHQGYYVKMGVAWALSVCYVKFADKTMRYLRDNHLDTFTCNKALQKIVESNRVSDDSKRIIRQMKR
jgi:3-methyladenine DNA glycosylase AlkD